MSTSSNSRATKIVVSSDSSSEPLRKDGDRLSLYFYPERRSTLIGFAIYILLVLGVPAAGVIYYSVLTARLTPQERAQGRIRYANQSNSKQSNSGSGGLILLLWGAGVFTLGDRLFRYNFRRPGPPGTSIKLTSSELSFRETLWHSGQVGAGWCDREESWDRGDVQQIRKAWAGPDTACDRTVMRGVEILPFGIRLGAGLSEADTAALLARLHCAWPETDHSGKEPPLPISIPD